MKTYYLDTNVILRFLLKDNERLTALARSYFQRAELGELSLVLPLFIVMEVNHVLRSVYGYSREEIAPPLLEIAQTPFLHLPDRVALIEALTLYQTHSIDLEDILLFSLAKHANAEVLSFDKDFKQLT